MKTARAEGVIPNETLNIQRHVAGLDVHTDDAALATLMTVDPNAPRLMTFEFHTSGSDAIGSINLGGHMNIKARPNDVGHSLVRTAGNVNQPDRSTDAFDGGLQHTRFHRGFKRRQESNIINELKDAETAYYAAAEDKKAMMRQNRSQALSTMRLRNGFNIITGQALQEPGAPPPRGGLGASEFFKTLPSLGPEAPQRGSNVLRESVVGRFHRPQESGDNHDRRQKVLVAGGLLKPQYSGVIQLGKPEQPSFGVEDNFSKSLYTEKPAGGLHGLVEKRQPGAFTPRKQPGNPSGNPTSRINWARGVVIG
jgi:hypothetical protein